MRYRDRNVPPSAVDVLSPNFHESDRPPSAIRRVTHAPTITNGVLNKTTQNLQKRGDRASVVHHSSRLTGRNCREGAQLPIPGGLIYNARTRLWWSNSRPLRPPRRRHQTQALPCITGDSRIRGVFDRGRGATVPLRRKDDRKSSLAHKSLQFLLKVGDGGSGGRGRGVEAVSVVIATSASAQNVNKVSRAPWLHFLCPAKCSGGPIRLSTIVGLIQRDIMSRKSKKTCTALPLWFGQWGGDHFGCSHRTARRRTVRHGRSMILLVLLRPYASL